MSHSIERDAGSGKFVPMGTNKEDPEGTVVEQVKLKIPGYRDLSAAEINLINRGKALANECHAYIEEVGRGDIDERWLQIGTIDLQKGFMSVIRAIAQPKSF